MGGVRRSGVDRMARARQPRNRLNGLRIADERVARGLTDWVLAAFLVLGILAIPWILGYVALATGAMS